VRCFLENYATEPAYKENQMDLIIFPFQKVSIEHRYLRYYCSVHTTCIHDLSHKYFYVYSCLAASFPTFRSSPLKCSAHILCTVALLYYLWQECYFSNKF